MRSRKFIILFFFLCVHGLLHAQEEWRKEFRAVKGSLEQINWIIKTVSEGKVYKESAGEMIEQGMVMANKSGIDSLIGKMHLLRGNLLQQSSLMQEAWDEYQKARFCFLKSKSYNPLLRTVVNQGWTLVFQEENDSAIRFLNKNRVFRNASTDPKVKLLFDVVYPIAYSKLGQRELAKEKYIEIILLAEQYGDTSVLVSSCINLSMVQDTPDSTLLWLRKAMSIVEGTSSSYYPEILSHIGYVYADHDGSIRDSALYYFNEAEKYEQNYSLDIYRQDLHNVKGSFLFSKTEYAMALASFQKAMSYYKEDSRRSNIVVNNIALCYIRLNKPDSAAVYIARLEKNMKADGGSDYEKLLYHQTKSLYFGVVRKDSCNIDAMKETLQSLLYAERIGDTRIGVEQLFQLLTCVTQTDWKDAGQKQIAIATLDYCKRFHPLLKKEEKLFNYSRFLGQYALLESRYGSKEAAITLFTEYETTVNKVWEEDYLKGMNDAVVKYKADLKDSEISLLSEKQEAASTRTLFITLALILVTLVMILLYVLYRRKEKSKKQLDDRNHKVEQLLREVHHRVKNNLQIVSSFINIQLDKVQDDDAAEALKDTSTRIMALAGLHQSLYRQEDLSRIQLKEYIEDLCNSIGATMGGNVNISHDVENLNLDIDQAIPVGLAVNELITNALKHAFTGRQEGHIHVSLHHGKQWELVVQDNGKGLPHDLDPNRLQSIGIRLVQDLAERQLRGVFSFYNDHGAVFKIAFTPQG